jgi:hypothetical protein
VDNGARGIGARAALERRVVVGAWSALSWPASVSEQVAGSAFACAIVLIRAVFTTTGGRSSARFDEIVAKRMKCPADANGATPFLDVRTAVLNSILEDAFRQCYPGFRRANDDHKATAAAA